MLCFTHRHSNHNANKEITAMETTHTPWYLRENGELNPDTILDTTPPVNKVHEHYKKLWGDSLSQFCIVDNVYHFEREKPFSEVYAAFCSLLRVMGEQSFHSQVACFVLSVKDGLDGKPPTLNWKAAQHLSQVFIDAYEVRQAAFMPVDALADGCATALERQFGEV
jgi:hypothetical protein